MNYIDIAIGRAKDCLEKHLRTHPHYLDKDGIARCNVCGEPLEKNTPEIGCKTMIKCSCDKQKEQEKASRLQREAAETEAMKSPLYDASYNAFTFANDDKADKKASDRCRAYVEHWEEVEQGNYGLLFSGELGTGKSYYAAAVVNALRNKGVSSMIVTTSRLLNAIKASKDPQAIIDGLNKFHFVVLDDLGSERDTDYAVEQLENFVNTRSLAKRPLSVTTNLTGKDLQTPPDLRYARIFDRVREMCSIPVILKGESRRIKAAQSRALRGLQILGAKQTDGQTPAAE